jgi:hypothetical protein
VTLFSRSNAIAELEQRLSRRFLLLHSALDKLSFPASEMEFLFLFDLSVEALRAKHRSET